MLPRRRAGDWWARFSVPVFALGVLVLACPGSSPDRVRGETAWAPSAEYREIRQRLARGWNTWNTRSVLSHVLLPEGFAINLAFKQHHRLDEKYLSEALIGRRGEGVESIRPGPHAYDGSYTELEIEWHQLRARVESATDGQDLVVLVTPLDSSPSPVKLIVESALLWNRPGVLARDGGVLSAAMPGRTVNVYTTADVVEDPYVRASTPYLVVLLDGVTGISTGQRRSREQIEALIGRQRDSLRARADQYGDLAEAYLAVQAGIAWNTVYEPQLERVVSTVDRQRNEAAGGYCLFGWDNFFLAYMTALESRDLAFANVLEHLRGKTDDGFIPNDNPANGLTSWDRSQPPVGGILVKEIYKRYPERWFLEATFDDLLDWNRWWMRKRNNGGLLSWGSHETEDRVDGVNLPSMTAAASESGMGGSPMYQSVPFNRNTSMMELHDVGLNSLYAADSDALAEMAAFLGRVSEARELRDRADAIRRGMEQLWDDEVGLYLNRRTDTGERSRRVSPTMFYPLLANVPDSQRAERILSEHFYDHDEFWGDWVLPTIARNDPAFEQQRSWSGAIWPPTNFLTYISLRRYGPDEAHRALADKSLAMFLAEWRRGRSVRENYSAITGTGDDPRLSSNTFHSWGALLGIMAFIERGFMAPTEGPLTTALP